MLKPGGFYIAITYGNPENRDFHFERPHLSWAIRQFVLYPADCETQEQKDEKSHYIYVCKKNEDADRISEEYFEKTCLQIILDAEKETEKDEEDSEKDSDEANKDLVDKRSKSTDCTIRRKRKPILC